MNTTCKKCGAECTTPDGWICRKEGNFYSTGEYSRTIEYFDIHGVSFNQKLDSIKHLLDSNTLQILKVLLQENDAPLNIDYKTLLEVYSFLDFIQKTLLLSNDNHDGMVNPQNTHVQYNSIPNNNTIPSSKNNKELIK